ncbi:MULTISPECIES: lipid A export permease/ATP-binding protein MsbA [unclassified Oleiphilus]|jgi:subfamily B ATP-binding cassette protein MsbA|uniref:lipid A export permease/ATP-binding protein MsbA n=6 Tax=Oleiphilus TaxID=141450 RepID=UPI0007C259F5|nr:MULTISPECIES: lipid A export permease/ATP-binding protein MsbA [unclassified Oleiphilus]KZY50237.1 lipid ABC transporter permease/ATP-binding protein [Oleiphilus sp. HI0050]KZY75628.1 lipid ABC transporter permease/ATP-binding protein [Oleiphilus sp. HI0069]KZZ19323.1 lipid ABC transporter permease/ATP-binding protein [Oleiphilus sp. HI0081]KZY39869.1 lipid ABC transporter permease/ATP-binding protein [Oleiphilus sp. HI0043]KZY61375.1 lipid ABC transporter permease/ATP-binding protein [Olei
MSKDSEALPELNESNWALYQRLLVYIKPLKFFFILSIIGNAIYAGASALMAQALDTVITTVENPTEENRLMLPLLIFSLFAMRGIGGFLGGYYIAYVGQNIVHRLRTQVFDRYLKLPSYYFDSNASGHLISRITFNVQQVSSAATDAITVIVREGLTVIGLFIVMINANWKLTLIFLAIGPMIGALVSYVSKRFRKLSKRIMASVGDVTHVTSEVVSGYRVVRIFGGENYESNRFNQASEYNLKQALKLEMTKAISTPVIQSLVALAIAVLVWLALAPDVRGDMTAGSFVVIIAAAATMAKPIRQLTQVNEKIQRGLAAAKDLFAVIDAEPEKDQGSFESARVQGAIEISDLNFAYEGSNKAILKNIDLSIKPGETVALVGRSGSGKSTLANLIPRFYEAQSGSITLDGVPVEDYTLRSLRDQISLVTQQVTLFNDTFTKNIAYGGLEGASIEDVQEAARKSNALAFIEDKDLGFDTELGDNGVSLSGGQRQRIAIARALLKDAPVLILDEATSALDTESEKAIQGELEVLMEGRTTIVIAHRLSTVENADKIVVMDQGRVIEQGTHQSLLAANGEYAKLYNMNLADDA